MKFIADLHIHSKFSLATSSQLDLENLYVAAQHKGITLLGTGDYTHPGWMSEIKQKLEPAEEGLFKLKKDIAIKCDLQVFPSCKSEVRFILQCEISTIYKKNGKTRKNHSLIFLPDIQTAEKFISKIGKIGNIKSDGRPIIGLDTKHLFEMILEISDKSILIPAHIWTPWFSMFGSKSGFDSINECFEDLSSYIYAVETGLSSNPPMNWRVKELDTRVLISNSDAHSPMNIGRNANRFDTELSYTSLFSAIKKHDANSCLGTIDLYPQEGKYHLDGHRKCEVKFHPSESINLKGICPVCNKPLTIGVLYRVEQLAGRSEGEKPDSALPYSSIICLADILSELLGTNPKTKKVTQAYESVIKTIGSELKILLEYPLEKINEAGIPLLSEAIKRMREGKIHISEGYDGEYGKITVFAPSEKASLLGEQSLFKTNSKVPSKKIATTKIIEKIMPELKEKITPFENKVLPYETAIEGLNEQQQRAVFYKDGALIIVAGPGTGKTRTLTLRIAHLIKKYNVLPEKILAVTFTNKASSEMKERLLSLFSNNQSFPTVETFHSLCYKILKNEENKNKSIIDEKDRKVIIREALRIAEQKGLILNIKNNDILDKIILVKQEILSPLDNLSSLNLGNETETFVELYKIYQEILSIYRLYDYEDLILNVIKLFESDKNILLKYQEKFQHIFIDEYQDLNEGQYRLVKILSKTAKNLCVIGDPDQSIYGFRGSDVKYFKNFIIDYPTAGIIHLNQNYRSTDTILETSHQVIKSHSINKLKTKVFSNIEGEKKIVIIETPTEKAEVTAIGKIIEDMIGGIGFHSIDFGKTNNNKKDRSFSDFAILFRTRNQSRVFENSFEKAGIPFQVINKENKFSVDGITELLSYLKIIGGIGSLIDLEKISELKKYGLTKKKLCSFKNFLYLEKIAINDLIFNQEKLSINYESAIKGKISDIINDILNIKLKTENKTVEEKLFYIYENTEIKPFIEHDPDVYDLFKKLTDLSTKFGLNVSDFIDTIALQTDSDFYDLKAEKVALMTLHSSKGLEFPVVFIAGCEDEYIPFKKPKEKEKTDIDEERRLFYVGMTRAQEMLYLTYSQKRTIYGKLTERNPSPFINNIEAILKEYNTQKFKAKQAKKIKYIQLSLF
ncbi:MAG: UvrD-helicase domain-containing protein [Desulfobacterales bacterium]|nr:UvrD-helicase domain-containing protein [Desulfobacterales bacterium]